MPPRTAGQWLMRVLVNPGVALVLRSPAHGLLSGSLMLLTVRGRKTGREHTLPVQYAPDGDLVYVIPGAPRLKRWWRNLAEGAPVRVHLRGSEVEGRAEVLTGGADPEAVIEGLKVYFERFPAAARMRGVRRMPGGAFTPESLRAAASQAVVVRIRITSDRGAMR